MAQIKLVTDSSVQLTPEEITANVIHIVPLSVEIDGKSYVDGVDITREELVQALRDGKFPKTSQPPMGKFVEMFDELGKDGSEVIAILLSDVLSGTVETAQAAAKMTATKVTVINSKSTDRAESFQVLAAAQDIRDGKSVDEIVAHCADIKSRTTTDVLVDQLDCLVRGGRVSKLAGALAKIANIKVIIRVHDDEIKVLTKGRSQKTFIKHCKQLAKDHENNPVQQLSLSNVGTDPAFLERIKDIILPENSNASYIARLTSPIIMTHTGLNAVGVITLAEKPLPEDY